jgi:hypothetical protein
VLGCRYGILFASTATDSSKSIEVKRGFPFGQYSIRVFTTPLSLLWLVLKLCRLSLLRVLYHHLLFMDMNLGLPSNANSEDVPAQSSSHRHFASQCAIRLYNSMPLGPRAVLAHYCHDSVSQVWSVQEFRRRRAYTVASQRQA